MFHWICPECGQEIAPGVKECPVCEPQASTTPAPEVALAATVAEPPAPVVKQAVVEPPIVEQPVQEPQVVLQPEVILRPEAVLPPMAFQGLKPAVVLDAIPAEARPVVIPDVPLGTSPVELPDPLLEPASDGPPHPETFADRLADLAELLHGEHLPYAAPRIFQESAAPGPRVESAPEKAPQVVDVTFDEAPARAMLAPPPSLLLLAEPQPPSVAPEIPIEAFHPRPAEGIVRSQEALRDEPVAASPVRLPESSRAVAPALAPFQDYYRAADRQMRPAAYATSAPVAAAAAVPKVTLPGPALPRELMSLQAAGLVPIRRGGGEGRPNRSGGMMKYVAVAILLTAGMATYSMMPASPPSAPPKPTPEPAPELPVAARPIRPANSLARFVEVTGIRFMEVNKKPQIHYLVVNHSSAPLGSVTVYVTLRATTAKPGQAPIARLTFRSPTLAAFEAKEMFSSIERESSPLDLPDWQDLRADVEVQ